MPPWTLRCTPNIERSLFIVYEAIIRIRLGSVNPPLPFFLTPITSSIPHHCCHKMVRLLIRPQRTQSLRSYFAYCRCSDNWQPIIMPCSGCPEKRSSKAMVLVKFAEGDYAGQRCQWGYQWRKVTFGFTLSSEVDDDANEDTMTKGHAWIHAECRGRRRQWVYRWR
jgi:hypothetical protein